MKNWGFSKKKSLMDSWPKDENGEPVPPVFFQHVGGTQLDVDMAVNLLEAFGIPSFARYPNGGDLGRIVLGVAGSGSDIYVPETMLAEAQNVVSGDFVDDETAEESGE